jgi:phosphoglycolate phosphatase-like HAD superfamily hydrolase
MTRAIFDLDGTLCDPAEGIVKSLDYALVAREVTLHD